MTGRRPEPRNQANADKIAERLRETLSNFSAASEREKIESRIGGPILKRQRPAIEIDELPEAERDKEA